MEVMFRSLCKRNFNTTNVKFYFVIYTIFAFIIDNTY